MAIKNKKSIVCGVLAACVVAAVCLAVFLCRGNSTSVPHETRPLVDVLDSANMMLVTPEGLGDRAKGRVVSGRAYQNFAQLLRFAEADESLQDTFKTECTTGFRVELFRDTLPVAKLRVAETIGRIGEDIGVWKPKNIVTIRKVNAFMWNQGVGFRACAIRGMTDFPEYVMDGLILESDTAIGTPLYETLKDANRATIFKPKFIPQSEINLFVKSLKSGEKMKIRKEEEWNKELDSNQVQELLSLLQNTKKESYAGHCLCKTYMTVTFYRDTTAIMKLNAISHDFGRFEKNQLEKDFGRGGSWEPADIKAVESFFARVKLQKEVPNESAVSSADK